MYVYIYASLQSLVSTCTINFNICLSSRTKAKRGIISSHTIYLLRIDIWNYFIMGFYNLWYIFLYPLYYKVVNIVFHFHSVSVRSPNLLVSKIFFVEERICNFSTSTIVILSFYKQCIPHIYFSLTSNVVLSISIICLPNNIQYFICLVSVPIFTTILHVIYCMHLVELNK